MNATPNGVKRVMLNHYPKSYLLLSEVGEPDRAPDGSPSAIAELRSERDPLTSTLYAEQAHVSESELRALWGDR